MKKNLRRSRGPLFEVRHSDIHGYGVFALRRIRKGTTILEYLGDRITHAQADARYEDKGRATTILSFSRWTAKTVLDAGVNGNDARFVNHGCDPNCQSTTLKKRIFIESIRTFVRAKSWPTIIKSSATTTILPTSMNLRVPLRR